MNDSRLLLQEFHTLLTEYGEKLPTTKMYRDSLIRRVVAELEAVRPEVAQLVQNVVDAARSTLTEQRREFARGDIGDLDALEDALTALDSVPCPLARSQEKT